MLYSCKPLFKKIKAQVAAEIGNFPVEDPPTVCIITTGSDEPSERYVRNKIKDFAEVGIDAEVKQFDTLLDVLCFLIDNGVKSDYDGIIVQRPILVSDATPKEAADKVKKIMSVQFDIDGVGMDSDFPPPSIRGLDLLLHEWDYDPSGKNAVIIGRGDVGRPVAEYLLNRDATVTICHSKTPLSALNAAIGTADIVVGAAGLKNPIYPNLHSDTVAIDYGIRPGPNGKLHGDIADAEGNRCQYKTTVPGGMGLMVRAGLLLNILDAYKRRREVR